MHKKVKQYLKKSLCGILSAAMIFTSLSIPDMTVYATEDSISDDVEIPDETKASNETTESDESKASDDVNVSDETNESTAEESEIVKSDVNNSKKMAKYDFDSDEEDSYDEKELNDEGDTADNYIIKEDFFEEVWEDGKLNGWGFAGNSWTVVGSNNIKASSAANRSGQGLGMDLWYGEADGTVEVYQTIASLVAGKYKMTAWMKGNGKTTKAKLYHGMDTSISGTGVLTNDETIVGTEWIEISYEFTLVTPKSNYNVGFAVTSEKDAWVCIDDVSLICIEQIEFTYSLEDLIKLRDEIKAQIEGKKAEDYKEGWNDLLEALAVADGLINEDSTNNTAITTAYINLQNAKNELKLANITATFYYYYGKPNKTLGVSTWNENNEISFGENVKESEESWLLNDDGWSKTVYLMEGSNQYEGWYSIDFVLDPSTDSGFDIRSSDDTKNVIKSFDKKYKNTEIFARLISGDAQSYAVDKDGNLYQGTEDIIAQINRNVTLHVYSEDGTPSIVTGSELSNIVKDEDKNVQIVEPLKESKKESDKYYYDMKSGVDEHWYSLTFIAPEAAGDNKKICDLYTKDNSGSYTEEVSFFEKESEDAADFALVFSGKTYYKDGKFYESKEAATGISLGMLKALIADTNNKVTEEDKYTEETWTKFKTARTTAQSVVNKLNDKGDDYIDEGDSTEIADAYNELKAAHEGLEEKEFSNTVTFYYYAGDTDVEKVGVYHWGANITSTAEDKDWKFWNTPMFKMTPTEYSGWYSVPLTFKGNIEDSANFQVIINDTEPAVFKCGSEASGQGNNDIYATLFEGKDTVYAVKLFGKGNDKTAKLYEGDKAEAAMRNITLKVYSENGTPAIGTADKLSAINESTGALTEITATTTVENVNYYQMTADAENEGWYTLTFSVPIPAENGEVFGLYIFADNKYGLIKKFTNTGANDSIDIASVFSGSIWYRDGKLYTDKELAEGITLGQLKQFLASEEVKAIIDKGEDAYTPESWNKFNTAKTKAETVVADFAGKEDGYKDDKITEAYSELTKAVENIATTGKVVTLYFHSKALDDYTDSETEKYHLYMSTWNKEKIASSKEEVELSQGTWNYIAFPFDKVTDEAINMGYNNWYSVPVKVIAANDGESGDGFIIQTGKEVTADNKTTHNALESDVALIKITYWENQDIYSEITSKENGDSIAIKDGKAYESISAAEESTNITKKLQNLVNEAEKLKKEDYKDGWEDFTKALATAKEILQKAADAEKDNTKTPPTEDEVNKAYEDLNDAIDALVPAREADINVKKVALTDDFITGADISSYIALKDSGVVFKDENGKALSDQGFFDYLKAGGMNWARIRIWNDPYNSSGNGYGGGNNDLEKAIRLGQWATKAGMRVLIDFHYSDFWADPKKQKAPKAWAGYNIEQKEEAVYTFTLDSLKALRDAGVDVGMVQVGNETNNGISGETSWPNMAKLFNAGSKAVREFDKNCLVAVHFTDPQKGYGGIAENLKKNNVDYDVFASSYYPFGHGDSANLKDVLEYVAKAYGKKVMAAETSWPTTLVDGDGYGTATPPTVPEDYKDQDYGVSVQGQADEMYDLIKAVNEINDTYPGQSLGVFYWEPAWISPYYIKDEDGNDNESLYKQNFELWEKYGSGWASSYAAEYDPDDAGVWFGGSAMDNSSWFDFDGTALPTAQIYSLIRTGASSEIRIASVDSNPVKKITVGESINWDEITVTAKYNNRREDQVPVTWDKDERELVNTDKAGEYIVHGIVSAEGKEYKITLTIQVLRGAANNILENPDFENNSYNPWIIDCKVGHGENESDSAVVVNGDDPHGGTKGLHFWSKIDLDVTISQTLYPEAGTYTFGSYIQGDGAGREAVQYAYVKVLDKDGKLKSNYKEAFTLNGWKNWVNPEITGITVADGDSVEVGLIIKSDQEGAWGTIDDFYLYGTHTVSVANNIKNGTVTANVVQANSGEKIIITVTPNSGYYPTTVTLSGASVNKDTLASSNSNVTFVEGSTDNQAILTYTAKMSEEKTETFTMPNGNVVVSAAFASVFEDLGNTKIKLDAKDESGKYLVQVNVGESKSPDGENPIADQYYTGKNITPAIELSYMGYKLTSADYTIKYEKNKNKTTDTSKAKITLTAKGDKFEGERTILFDIVEDTRKDFSAKTLKIAFETPDKGDKKTTSKAVYYLGKQKEIEPKIGLYDNAWRSVSEDLYEVYYQNNKKIGKATVVVLPTEEGLKTYKDGSISATFTIAKCPVNQDAIEVKVDDKKPSYYTGKKVEPSITVTYKYTEQGSTELKTVTLAKGTDYTITCTNNVNASVYKNGQGEYVNINNKKVPTYKITGKGNFAGVRTTVSVTPEGKSTGDKLTFKIYPKDLANTVVTVSDLAVKTSAQAPKITVKDGTKTVPASQYTITEIFKITNDAEGNEVKDKVSGTKITSAGTYEIKIKAKDKSNYEGTKDVSNAGSNDKLTFKVVDKEHLMANAKVSISGKFYYTGEGITLSTQAGPTCNLTVKAGGKTLDGFASKNDAKGDDGVERDGYYVTYSSNVNAGKATVTITGTGAYVGTKTAAFTINKRTLAKNVDSKDKSKKGKIQTPRLSAKSVKEKLDGTLSPVEKGAIIDSDREGEAYGSLEVPYTGYTINPDFKFNSENYDLAGNALPPKELATSDYTVSYKVNKWKAGKAPVTVTVKGKGNYSGSVKFENLFTLTARDFSELSIEVASATYNGKALKPAVTFYDKEGKIVNLKLNTAYTVKYQNNKESGAVNTNTSKKPKVIVKPKGKGWTTSSANKTYEKNFVIEQAEITKLDISDVKFQTFMGKVLKPKVVIKVNGRKLKKDKDYVLTYSGNGKRSSENQAKITITGKGNYFTRTPIVKDFVVK